MKNFLVQWSRLILAGIILLFLCVMCSVSQAGEPTRVFSAGAAVKRGYALAADFSLRLGETDDHYWQASLSLVGESDGQPNNAALQGLYVAKFGRVEAGIGVALLQNVDEYNGSRANFALQLGYRFNKYQVQWRHWSNAGTEFPNLGRDMFWLGREF